MTFFSDPIVQGALRLFLGALIGYITNDIAIRMLFRPRRAKYLFGKQLPFTPGIIPKEKGRIAEAIGKAVSENLINKDVIERALLSDDMIAKIETAFTRYVEKLKGSDESLATLLARNLSAEGFSSLKTQMLEEIKSQLSQRLAESELGDEIADVATAFMVEKVRNSVGKLIPGSPFVAEAMITPLKKLISKNVNAFMRDGSPQLVAKLVDQHADAFLNTPVSDLLDGRSDQISDFRNMIVAFYRNIIETKLPQMLAAVDLSKMVENRINEMDVEESERLILSVVNRELKALVWLGALLGFLMGGINLLF